MPDSLSNSQALEVFLRGFSATRSFIRPYLVHSITPTIWLLADEPSRAARQRTSEMIVYGATQHDVVEARDRLGLVRHTLCVLLDDPDQAGQAAPLFKQVGYRLLGREPFFVLDTAERIQHSAVPVRRIADAESADTVAKAAGARQLPSEHLTAGDSLCRVYAAYDRETPIGWVRSIRTHPDCAWVAGLYVQAAHRRRGIGRTLMSAMLDDDARFGVKWSVLLASLTGALLYPHLGYRQQGLLLLFSRQKKSSGCARQNASRA